MFCSFKASDQHKTLMGKGLLVGGPHWSPGEAGRLIPLTYSGGENCQDFLQNLEKKGKTVTTVRRISAYRKSDIKETDANREENSSGQY